MHLFFLFYVLPYLSALFDNGALLLQKQSSWVVVVVASVILSVTVMDLTVATKKSL